MDLFIFGFGVDDYCIGDIVLVIFDRFWFWFDVFFLGKVIYVWVCFYIKKVYYVIFIDGDCYWIFMEIVVLWILWVLDIVSGGKMSVF